MTDGPSWPRIGVLLPYSTARDVTEISSCARAAEGLGVAGL